MNVRERLKKRISQQPTGCWEWTGAVSEHGYGRIKVDGINCLAPRMSWCLFKGNIPRDICVLHKCDNRLCINPKHLFLGTRVDNIRDMVKKNRQRGLKCEANPRSKLTRKAVKAIRKEYASAGTFQHILAKKFGVSQPVISKIIRNERWVYP